MFWVAGVLVAAFCCGFGISSAQDSPASPPTDATPNEKPPDAQPADGQATDKQPTDDGAASEAQQAQIAGLIGQLGDADYETRAEAQRQLARLGPLAFDALAIAEGNSDVEISRRATYLLRSIRIPWIRDDDPADVRQLLRNYDALDEAERRQRIDGFAAMPSDVSTGPLCRIVRYEKRSSLAKKAALLIADRPPPEGETLDRQRATIRRTLGASRRTAARWLLAYEKFFAEPDEALAEWEKILAEETAALARRSGDASAEQIFRLRKRQYAMLVARGRTDDAQTVIGQMVLLVPAETPRLVEFVEWLGKAEAWAAIDDLAKRHAALFERQPILVYALANAQLSAGKQDEAEATARRALAIRPMELETHVEAAMRLVDLGLFAWAEREWRFVIEKSPQDSGLSIYAGAMMASILQDQAEYLKAAEARKAIVERFEANASLREQFESAGDALDDALTPKRIRAAMDYCYAMHYAASGDAAKQVEHLEKAVAADPNDADVLIALYRLSYQDDARRARTKRRIERATRAMQIKIDQLAPIATEDRDFRSMLARRHNEYAWLVSNTFGDFDRALEYAIKSNDFSNNLAAGGLDTLARCHFAKGDLDSAIRVQTRANQLEPHSGAIARQLAFFRDEAARRDAAKRAASPAGGAPRATEPE
ncbi:MAG: hypothetical protein WD875_00125 [Pirellulales bacterium]